MNPFGSILRITFGDAYINRKPPFFSHVPIEPYWTPPDSSFFAPQVLGYPHLSMALDLGAVYSKAELESRCSGTPQRKAQLVPCRGCAWRLLGWGVWDLTWFNYIVYIYVCMCVYLFIYTYYLYNLNMHIWNWTMALNLQVMAILMENDDEPWKGMGLRVFRRTNSGEMVDGGWNNFEFVLFWPFRCRMHI